MQQSGALGALEGNSKTKQNHIKIVKLTNPSSDTTTSLSSTPTGGPTLMNQSFNLTGGASDSGSIKPGSGYATAET